MPSTAQVDLERHRFQVLALALLVAQSALERARLGLSEVEARGAMVPAKPSAPTVARLLALLPEATPDRIEALAQLLAEVQVEERARCRELVLQVVPTALGEVERERLQRVAEEIRVGVEARPVQ